jgi:hypothetical protein
LCHLNNRLQIFMLILQAVPGLLPVEQRNGNFQFCARSHFTIHHHYEILKFGPSD